MSRRIVYRSLAALLLCLAGAFLLLGRRSPTPNVYQARPPGTVTFTEHIAPILYQHCVQCHRPGQAAPFTLLTYDQAHKHARQIAEVTQSRYMPPWLPDPGFGEFERARLLSADQIGLIQQWANENAPDGDPQRLPSPPQWPDGWQLGQPDLVITMPEPFTLPADGPDVYRNFVIPVRASDRQFVRALELDPGNPSIVHHAFIRFDRTPQARQRAAEDPAPGFEGIHAPASVQPPEGFFLSWQPGRLPSPPRDGFAWALEPNSDAVVQMHLQPSGKPEKLQARLAFYFSDRPPRFKPLKIWLSSYNIKIPAGQSDYVLEDHYTLPADVDVLGILPHTHYLGSKLEAFAVHPNGERTELLRISHWDFNWQGDYRYVKPIPLSKGSQITMRFHYDNSTNNTANPNYPPKEVRYGLQSTDEMGELWLQVLPRNDSARSLILHDYEQRVIQDTVAYNSYLLTLDPQDAKAHSGIGKALYFMGRFPEASQRFQTAIKLAPTYDEPHYYLGLIFRRQDRLVEAVQAFNLATQFNPDNSRAWGNLGQVHLQLVDYGQAEKSFRNALRADSTDVLAHDGLGVALYHQGRLAEAKAAFQTAYDLSPEDPNIKQHLEAIK